MILNQLGGESAVAEVSEREFRLMRQPQNPDSPAEGAKPLFSFQSRGESDDAIYETNRAEWAAFTAGTKRIALVSAAVASQLQLPASAPVLVLYCDTHSVMPDLSLFSSPSPVTLRLFCNAPVDSLAVGALLSQLRRGGATGAETLKPIASNGPNGSVECLEWEVTVAAVEKAMERWGAFVKTGKLPIGCGAYVRREDGEMGESYLEGNQTVRVECVMSQVRTLGLASAEMAMSLDQVMNRVSGSSLFCQKLIMGVLRDLVKFVSDETRRQLEWESGVSSVKGEAEKGE